MLRSHPVVATLLPATGVFLVANAALSALLVPLGVERLGGATAVGVVLSALGVGFLAGAPLLRLLVDRTPVRRLLAGAQAATAVGFVLLVNASWLPQAVVLDRAGFRDDPRTRRARDVVAGKQRRDGGWRAVRPWWRPPGSAGMAEAVDWGPAAHQMVTLNALRVLSRRDAGRTPVPRRPSPAGTAAPPRR